MFNGVLQLLWLQLVNITLSCLKCFVRLDCFQSMDNMSKEMEALKEKEKLTSPAQLQCASDP